MRSNCLIFACLLRWRRRERAYRSYFSWRKSDWGWFPHIVYTERRRSGFVHMVSFKPLSPSKRLMPPPLFRGKVVWGDPKMRATLR